VSDTHKVMATPIIHSCHVSFGFAGNRDNGLVTFKMFMWSFLISNLIDLSFSVSSCSEHSIEDKNV
jgi:hypothetical protein